MTDDKAQKYARSERERRFLLDGPPSEPPIGTTRIDDRYLVGTRLRLRRMTPMLPDGRPGRAIFKLAQKVPPVDGPWGLITNLYLSPAEYDAVAALPAHALSKVRAHHGAFSVDTFEDASAGLTLAEVEFDDDAAAARFEPPFAYVAEVTTDIRFTGGSLATTDRTSLLALLSIFGLDPIPSEA